MPYSPPTTPTTYQRYYSPSDYAPVPTLMPRSILPQRHRGLGQTQSFSFYLPWVIGIGLVGLMIWMAR